MSDQNISIKRNLAIMWFANFFIAGSMTVILPFLSLHINTFGNFSSS
ncbi:MAG TPA: MFS transporter, partial [Virgibacillus sp.]|nr:MFS transporter [Virgibacillus sp.]